LLAHVSRLIYLPAGSTAPVMNLSILRLQRQRPLKMGDRRNEVTLILQDVGRFIYIRRSGSTPMLGDQVNGDIVSTRLVGDNPKVRE
jgi:hypothetical protein